MVSFLPSTSTIRVGILLLISYSNCTAYTISCIGNIPYAAELAQQIEIFQKIIYRSFSVRNRLKWQ